MQIIAVDCGRDTVKAVSEGKSIKFPSVVGKWFQRELNTDGNYEVEVNKEKHFIGELAEIENDFSIRNTNQSKIHEETKILTLSACALLAKEEEITLITAVPVDDHNAENKKKMADLLKGSHVVKVNGKTKVINIVDVLVSIEGAGILFNQNMTAKKIRVIDIGSMTTNYLTCLNGKFVNKDSFTDAGKACIKLSKSRDGLESFAKVIISNINASWPDYDGEPIILGGGGALKVGELIQAEFSNAIIADNPVEANVNGFYKIAVVKCQK